MGLQRSDGISSASADHFTCFCLHLVHMEQLQPLEIGFQQECEALLVVPCRYSQFPSHDCLNRRLGCWDHEWLEVHCLPSEAGIPLCSVPARQHQAAPDSTRHPQPVPACDLAGKIYPSVPALGLLGNSHSSSHCFQVQMVF